MSLHRSRPLLAVVSVAALLTGLLTLATPAQAVDEVTIAAIQGTGDASPLVGTTVSTTGVVTASYPSGGLAGFFLQTDGTGGATDATPGASDGLFVYGGSGLTVYPSVGDAVRVTGAVSEFSGLTELSVTDGGVEALPAPTGVTALAAALPTTDAAREAHEGELLAPSGRLTVTDTFSTNQYAEIGLATGARPLVQPTDLARPGTPEAATIAAANAARAVTLDDGSSTNFLSAANQGIALPWLTPARSIRVGAAATLVAPVVLDWRNATWKLQPQHQVTDDGSSVATFADTRTQAPESVGGDLRLATFNVLNYFDTTGEDYVAAGGSCTFYADRDGDPVTDRDCGATGPRGAAGAADLERQQDKIVAAINALGADVVSLEEIENSVVVDGTDRDGALSTLVAALNTAAGSTRWAFAPSPGAADLPDVADQDVIRTAFIYDPTSVALVGGSEVLDDPAFANARQPLAQAFRPAGGTDDDAFSVIVNHFKSKGDSDGSASGDNVDAGDGQGSFNGDRVRQATALAGFASSFAADRGTDAVLLTGDFNSYTQEDPLQVLYGDGYSAVESDTAGEATYSFDGLSGSLDHVLANDAARALVTGADVWSINSGESPAYEYSRHDYNVTDFYAPDAYRSSDHDPEVVGLDTGTPDPSGSVSLNLLAVNDFHGRIDTNTVRWAGTVEELTAEGGGDDTLLVGAGDLVGASLFASAVDGDQPTIDMFNALGLDASAVGNHEFDQGWPDLRDRIIGPTGDRNARWAYLGANVYDKTTGEPVLPEYATFDVDGVSVGVIGAVTEETASLVSPGGIADIEFGDPVEAVNRVAAELSDGDPANGEADVIVASFHAGATQGVGSDYAAEVAKGGEFAEMADLDPAVDAILNGHTHQAYAWDAPVPGDPTRTRPIIQTGSYGDNVGQVGLTIDRATGEVTDYTVRNVARTTVSDDELVSTYPRVTRVKTIVDAALARAAVVGNQPVGSITADITTAYVGEVRDDRASESTLGDLVADALRDGIPADLGEPDLAVVNPGGLRNELVYDGDTTTNPANTDGVVTYAEANAVLPFVNNLWLIDLTGAELQQVLEQQWQPTGASRPYLALGLSDNVRVTQDPTRPAGSRITSVLIDGQPLDPGATYTVSTFSFLGTGGDNFTAFTSGTARDTGLVDREVWIGYLRDHPGLAPDFARQQVVESGLPASVAAGDQVSFSLSGLDLTSLGSPANTSLTVSLRTASGDDVAVGDVPVVGGQATVSFTAPADLDGPATIGAVARPSGTLIGTADDRPVATTVSAAATALVYGRAGSVRVSVSSDGGTPTGIVRASYAGRVLGSAVLSDGAATVALPARSLRPGARALTVSYLGDEGHAASDTTATVAVARADARMRVTAPDVVRRHRPVRLRVRVAADGVDVRGRVTVSRAGRVLGRARLQDGRVRLRLDGFPGTGRKRLVVRYLGNDLVTPERERVVVRVRR